MTIRKKHGILLILVCVSLAIVLLSASLSSLDLRSYRARERGTEVDQQEAKTGIKLFSGSILYIFLRLVLLLTGLLIPLAIFLNLLSPSGRKRILVLFILALLFILIGNQIPRGKIFQRHRLKLNIQGLSNSREQPISPVERIIPKPPWWLVISVSTALSVLILAVFYVLWRRLRRQPEPLGLVAREAQKTLDKLSTGTNLEEGVIQCYHEMSNVLSNERGIKRQRSMTTREFESYLEAAGLPGVYIKRLTRLFEKVRYGARNLGNSEDREAADCRTAIVRACEGS